MCLRKKILFVFGWWFCKKEREWRAFCLERQNFNRGIQVSLKFLLTESHACLLAKIYHSLSCLKYKQPLDSGCSSVGRAVAYNSKGPQFECSHWQTFILYIYCQLYWKDENKEKGTGNGPFFKKKLIPDDSICRFPLTINQIQEKV